MCKQYKPCIAHGSQYPSLLLYTRRRTNYQAINQCTPTYRAYDKLRHCLILYHIPEMSTWKIVDIITFSTLCLRKKTNNDICHSVHDHRMITITTHYPRLRERAVSTNHVLQAPITHRPLAITHGQLNGNFSLAVATTFITTEQGWKWSKQNVP